jgi:transcriptional regulator with GAF, ATPase, and Fis domain
MAATPGKASGQEPKMPRELDETWQLLDDFAGAVRLLQVQGDRSGEVLPVLCELSLKIVGGDHASVTTIRDGRFTTVQATSDLPERADQIQYDTGQGPCLDAIREADTFRIDDLSTDPRWPTFGRLTSSRLGMHSMLAHVLPVTDDAIGAINIYAARPHAFSAEHETLIAILGSTATSTLRVVHHENKTEQLEAALRTSRRIGVALGILMATRSITLDQAWTELSKASQNSNLKVSVLANHVVEAGTMEALPPELRKPAV